MAWAKSISLDVANKIFGAVGIEFKVNDLEGGYIAKHKSLTMRRPTLTTCCIDVLKEWMTVNESTTALHKGG